MRAVNRKSFIIGPNSVSSQLKSTKSDPNMKLLLYCLPNAAVI